MASRNNAPPNQRSPQRCFVGRNVVHHVKEFPTQVKMGLDVILSQNKFFRVRGSQSSFSGGDVLMANYDHCNTNGCATNPDDWYSDNVWVIFNELYDAQSGIAAHQQIHCTDEDACAEACCPNTDEIEGCDEADLTEYGL